MMIESLIFDIGNVLVQWDPEYLYKDIIQDEEERRAFLKEVVTLEWHTAHDAGLPMREGVRRLSKQFPHYAEEIDLFRTRWFDTIGPVIQGSVDLLHCVHKSAIPLYGLTNFSAETYPRFVKDHAFMKLFNDVLVSGEVGMVKPDPRIFSLAIKRFAINPQHCLFIDDRLPNIEAGKKAGLQTHLFEGPHALAKHLKHLGVIEFIPL